MNKAPRQIPRADQQRGFTLVELMTVVLIVGILFTLVVPSYRESVRKAHRSDGQAVMLELSQFMERFYTENGRYDQDRAGTAITTVIAGSALLRAPKEGGATNYNLALSNLAQQTFTITATPTGSQTGDKCGNLTLTQAGVKGVTSATVAVDKCW
ncbi:MAG: type IV pilin protein [Pseudomonadota bacterium]